jgi:hypothetical protein
MLDDTAATSIEGGSNRNGGAEVDAFDNEDD